VWSENTEKNENEGRKKKEVKMKMKMKEEMKVSKKQKILYVKFCTKYKEKFHTKVCLLICPNLLG